MDSKTHLRSARTSRVTQLSVGCAIAALVISFPAIAQTDNSLAAKSQTSSGQNAGPATTAPITSRSAPVQNASPSALTAQPDTVADIVVTANRRSENLQRSALAVSVLSADTLARASVTSAASLSTLTPGLQIGGNGASTQIFIRGVGDRSNTFLSNASVTTNLNGVPQLRSTEVNGNFYDLERIEVLKGPQGTLYGRNATGGAINLLPARPTQTLGGFINVEGGSYNLFKTEGALNLPISDTLALRGAFQIVRRDGYLSDGTSDDKQQNGRLTALWRPTSEISVLVTGGYSHQGGAGAGLALIYPRCSAATGCVSKWTGILDPIANTIRLNSSLPGSAALASYPAAAYPALLDNTVTYITGELNWDLGPATLTVLPSYTRDHYISNTYPGLVFANNILAQQHSVETRLSHNSSRFKWVAGFFYIHENQTGNNPVIQNTNGTGASTYNQLSGSGASIDSKAAFAQATYGLTDRLRLTGGVRYTDETSGLNEQEFSCSIASCPGTFLFSIDNKKVNTKKFTYKGGVEYDLAPDHFLYATYSTGFKAAGLYTAPVADPTYKPEKIDAIEIGSRNRFLDGKVQINLEAYRWNYSNQVINFVGPVPGLNYVTLVFLNIGKGRVQGGSADIAVKPWKGGTFRFAADYADSSYSDFQYDALVGQKGIANTACPVGATHLNAAGVPVQTVNCSGRSFILAPKISGSASFEQVFILPDNAQISAAASVGFTSSRYSQYDFLPTELLPSTALVDFDLTYRAPSGKWSVGAYVHNIGNVASYSQSQSLTGTGGATSPAGGPLIAGTICAPRTAGGKLSYRF